MTIEPTPAEQVDPARPSRVWRRTIRRLVMIVLVLLVAVAITVTLFISEKNSSDAKSKALAAAQQSLRTSQQQLALAKCINDALATRNAPSGNDADAYRKIFAAINTVFLASVGEARTQAFVDLEQVLATEQKVLDSDAAFRAAHPLGQC